jgi:hypothetical protein
MCFVRAAPKRKSQLPRVSRSINMLSMVKDGKSKLPMNRALALANAPECEPALLAN